MTRTLNLNDQVKVQLTESGAQAYNRYLVYTKVCAIGSSSLVREFDVLQIPLWELIAAFGGFFPKPNFTIGGQVRNGSEVFISDNIEFL